MALKFLQCAEVVPDGQCTLMFVGESDEVLRVFAAHQADRHASSSGGQQAVDQLLHPVVLDGGSRAYVGDVIERTDTGGLRVPGPGLVMREYGEDSGITMDCKCQAGSGGCEITVSGPVALCEKESGSQCTNCTFQVGGLHVKKPRFLPF